MKCCLIRSHSVCKRTNCPDAVASLSKINPQKEQEHLCISNTFLANAIANNQIPKFPSRIAPKTKIELKTENCRHRENIIVQEAGLVNVITSYAATNKQDNNEAAVKMANTSSSL